MSLDVRACRSAAFAALRKVSLSSFEESSSSGCFAGSDLDLEGCVVTAFGGDGDLFKEAEDSSVKEGSVVVGAGRVRAV